MAIVVPAYRKLLRHYQVWWSRRMDKGLKMEGYYHRQKVGDVDPVERRSYAVRCSLSVICSLWRDSTCMQHFVQLGTDFQQWQANCTVGCRRVASQHLWSHPEAPKEMAAMSRRGRALCWARSCLMFCLDIKLLQMRWLRHISERPSCLSA